MDQLKQKWAEFWQVRTSQEQTMLSVCAVVVVAALVYLIGIDPALTGRAKLEKELPVLRMQAAQFQALAAEAQALAGRAGQPTEAMTREGVEKALVARGMTPKTIGMIGDQVKVQLDGVAFSTLVAWLDEVQKVQHITVFDANIVSQASVGVVNATLSLRQQKNE